MGQSATSLAGRIHRKSQGDATPTPVDYRGLADLPALFARVSALERGFVAENKAVRAGTAPPGPGHPASPQGAQSPMSPKALPSHAAKALPPDLEVDPGGQCAAFITSPD